MHKMNVPACLILLTSSLMLNLTRVKSADFPEKKEKKNDDSQTFIEFEMDDDLSIDLSTDEDIIAGSPSFQVSNSIRQSYSSIYPSGTIDLTVDSDSALIPVDSSNSTYQASGIIDLTSTSKSKQRGSKRKKKADGYKVKKEPKTITDLYSDDSDFEVTVIGDDEPVDTHEWISGEDLDLFRTNSSENISVIGLDDTYVYTCKRIRCIRRVSLGASVIWEASDPGEFLLRAIINWLEMAVIIENSKGTKEYRKVKDRWVESVSARNEEISLFKIFRNKLVKASPSEYSMKRVYGDCYLYEFDQEYPVGMYEFRVWDLSYGERPKSILYTKNRNIKLIYDDRYLIYEFEVKKKEIGPPRDLRLFTKVEGVELPMLKCHYDVKTIKHDSFNFTIMPEIKCSSVMFGAKTIWTRQGDDGPYPLVVSYSDAGIILFFKDFFIIFRQVDGEWLQDGSILHDK